MKNVFKKIGSILFCLLPALLAFGIQLIVSFAAVFLKVFSIMFANPKVISDMDLYIHTVTNAMDSVFLSAVSAIYAVIAAIVLGLWYWKKFVHKKFPKRKVSQIINPQMFAGLLALMIGLQYLSTYIVNLVAFINPNWYKTYEDLMNNMGFSEVSWVLALYSIIIAPISEELIFRGVTLHYAQRIMPFWVANAFQAVLFGIFHANVVQGTYAFVVGLFCGYVCQRGGSIYLSILFHMLFNIWGTFAPGNLFFGGNATVMYILVFIVTIAISFLGFYLYDKGVAKRNPLVASTEE